MNSLVLETRLLLEYTVLITIIWLLEPGSVQASAHAGHVISSLPTDASCLFRVVWRPTAASLFMELEAGTASSLTIEIRRFHSTWLGPPACTGDTACIIDPTSIWRYWHTKDSISQTMTSTKQQINYHKRGSGQGHVVPNGLLSDVFYCLRWSRFHYTAVHCTTQNERGSSTDWRTNEAGWGWVLNNTEASH